MLTVQSFIQFPVPGLGEKYWSLSGFPSHVFQSGGGAFLTVIFGQIFAYCAFNDSHFSSPGSVSALIASTGFRLANTAIDALLRVDDEHVLALVETIHWAHLDAVHCFATNAVIVDDVGHLSLAPADRRDELIHGVRHHGTYTVFYYCKIKCAAKLLSKDEARRITRNGPTRTGRTSLRFHSGRSEAP